MNFVLLLMIGGIFLGLLTLAGWGLLNAEASVVSAMAGLLLALLAVPGGLHAWSESRSVPWTTAYLILFGLGSMAVGRQVVLAFSHRGND